MRTRTLLRSNSEALRRLRTVRSLLLYVAVGGQSNKQIKQWCAKRRELRGQ